MISGEYMLLCLKASIRYIPTNLLICLFTLIVSLVLGILVAMGRVYRIPVLSPILDMLMAFLKAIPVNLVLLICIILYTNNFASIVKALHLNISIKDVSLLYVAVFSLVICTISPISEVVRGGLISVDKGQYEAGYSVGLTKWQTFRTIILPQAARSMVAPLTNSTLALMKSTSLVSVIGVMDIINGSITAASEAYCYFEAYLAASLVFWVIGYALERLSALAERRLSVSVKLL